MTDNNQESDIEKYAPPERSVSNGGGVDWSQVQEFIPGILAIMVVLTYCVTILLQIAVDDKFVLAVSIILSFYFGSKKGGGK